MYRSRLMLAISLLPVMNPLLAAEVVRFAPLPMASLEQMTREYLPFLDYLEKQTGKRFELSYHASYDTLIDELALGHVDMAYLGPLPYVALTEKNQHIEPLVKLLDNQGQSDYTCALVHFADHSAEMNHPDRMQNVALTQPLSTCGYLMVESYLQGLGQSLEDSNHHYDYTGSHENVALSVVLDRHDFGGMKTQIARRYQHLGLRVIDETAPLPGFVLVANTQTMDQTLIQQIRTGLLTLKPLNSIEDAEVVRAWSANLRYGAVEVDDREYAPIRQQWRELKVDLVGAGK